MKNKTKFLCGLEREALRIKKDGSIDLSLHPATLGNKLYNPYITTDFSESQLELITKPHSSNEETLNDLCEILSYIKHKEPSILLHPFSMPPKGDAPTATFGKGGEEKEQYRKYLKEKYGTSMQLISGIHYNFSIVDLADAQYFHIIRNTLRYGFLFPALFGNTSDNRFPSATSIRGSSYGYFPKFQQMLFVDFHSTEGYTRSLVECSDLYGPMEYYLFIRPKFKCGKVHHLELRSIDIDPTTPCGIYLETMEFAKDFFFKMLELPSPSMDKEELFNYLSIYERVCLYGDSDLVKATLEKLGLEVPLSHTSPKVTPKMFPHLEKAVESSLIEGMEVSTKLIIEDAKKYGLTVSIIDIESNTIKICQGDHSQIISQATFTEQDSFLSYRLQQNKHLTKTLLSEAGLSTTSGLRYYNSNIELDSYLGRKICIKPSNANYGDGISILQTKTTSLIKEAVDLAFSHSPSILIEEFFEGDEYRFFVIDGDKVFVCKRMPPFVIGDGVSSLEKLIAEANLQRPKEFPILGTKNLSYIVDKGKKYVVRENSNVSTGGTAIDYTDKVCESYKDIARSAAKSMKGFLCGVDILIKDSKLKANRDNYAIVETNYNPALYLHRHPFFGEREITRAIFEALGFDCTSDKALNNALIGDAISN